MGKGCVQGAAEGLKRLKDAGLLTSERRGTWVYYRVEPSGLAAMGRLLVLAPVEAA